MTEILMAAESAAVTLDDGIPRMIEAGRTMAHADHPIVTGCPSLWQPLKVHYSTAEPEPGPEGTPEADSPQPGTGTTDTPGAEDETKAPATPVPVPDPPQPDAKAVRAWAADQGIEVPARGKIPADVVEAYQAAHQGA